MGKLIFWLSIPVLIFSMFYFLPSCSEQPEKSTPAIKDSVPKKDISIRGSFSDQQVLHIDNNRIPALIKNFPGLAVYASEMNQFYIYRKFSYAWYDGHGLIEQANNLYNHLNNLTQDGILIPVPYLNFLDSLLNDPLVTQAPDPQLDVLLSAEYFFYADKVWNGIPEKKTTNLKWFLPRKKLNLPYIMDSVLRDSTAQLFSNSYSISQYNILKQSLRIYRHLDSTASWQLLKTNIKSFTKGDSAFIIRQIRHRLFLFGDIAGDSGGDLFDTSMVIAVRSFQERYGMNTDGVIGSSFIARMNTPLSAYIRKIIVNMERMRWIPTNISKHFLLINIPAFSLYAYDDDTVTFRMNVVVGKDVHKTVLFSGDLQYIVFSPYWNIPPSIMKAEILPAIQRDPGYLKRNNMEWNGNAIRQKPGPKNSLGLVKFLFPNSYNIYLHDSPAKSLFNQPSRAFSHGCIRLAEPAKLAGYLLKNDPSWSDEKINQAMHSGKEKYVTLKQTIPVYIGYFTAYSDNKGKIHFRDDVYNRDQSLEEMLIQK
jgi:murein L,D-transpeptidase YcbB/YkuD